jgi:hypothetical protein
MLHERGSLREELDAYPCPVWIWRQVHGCTGECLVGWMVAHFVTVVTCVECEGSLFLSMDSGLRKMIKYV